MHIFDGGGDRERAGSAAAVADVRVSTAPRCAALRRAVPRRCTLR